MKKIYLFIIAFLIISYSRVNAQEQLDPLKQNIEYNIDNLGDAHIQISRVFNASQWDNYKKIYAANAAALLKREMERGLPTAYLQNFSYKEDEMNRTFTLTFDALGFAKINDNGQWQLDVGVKNPDLTKITDRNYAMTVSFNSGGALLQNLIKLNMPDGAANITQEKNAFGKPIFTYELTPGHKKVSFIFLAIGILLFAGAIVTFIKPDLFAMSAQKRATKYPFAPAAAPVSAPAQPVAPEQGQSPAANSASQS
jgi:hypothetical protein